MVKSIKEHTYRAFLFGFNVENIRRHSESLAADNMIESRLRFVVGKIRQSKMQYNAYFSNKGTNCVLKIIKMSKKMSIKALR